MTMRFAIIGAGMAGILATIKLREAGYEDIVVYEKADRVGGTWRENTYPGIACDVPSHAYSYSFELNPEWSHRFSPGSEIQAYFEGVADRHGVRERVRFGEEVVRCEFIDGRWHLRTDRGTADVVDVVIAATGVLHHPNIPTFEGMDRFEGACFHSARWDHSVPLDGRRVGVIGTGSTAVQITSALVDRVAHFSLFQRTAQWVIQVDNPAFSEEERAAFRGDPSKVKGLHDHLSRSFREAFAAAVIDADSPKMRAIEDQCRANLEEHVTDPVLCEQLRPTYRAACKRLVASPDFYEKIQHPNASLVTSPIERIEPTGVRTADGVLHELDVLVLATGFRVDRFVRPTVVTGRDGVDLDDVWRDGPIAYLSVAVPGFPNFFMLNGPNGPVGNFSLIEVAEMQVGYILQLLEQVRSGRCTQVSPSWEATRNLEAERREAAVGTVWTTGCNSWYLDKDGVPATWTFTFDRFCDEMASPKLDAYELAG